MNYRIIILTIFLTVLFTSCSKEKHIQVSQFISSKSCSMCHKDIYKQWQGSMHNLAHRDPLYIAIAKDTLKTLTNEDHIAEAESCVKCHAPIGFISNTIKTTSEELNRKHPDIIQEGIQCDYCHSATGTKKLFNNGLNIKIGEKQGPRKDSKSPFHESAYSDFHQSAKMCGTCHNVKHVAYKTNLESTYEEWLKSPYNSKDPKIARNCQSCHMYQRPRIPSTGSTDIIKNPGKSAFAAPTRDHIFTHYFVGGNSTVPPKFGNNKQASLAVERLKNAAKISLDTSNLKNGILSISVKNTGAGHYLPTGVTHARQLWLQIKIKTSNGKIIYSTGDLTSKGYLKPKTIIYNTIFGDKENKPTLNIAKAFTILKDKRIPPKKSLTEKIDLKQKLKGRIVVTIKLLYRSAPQSLTDKLLKKDTFLLPITTMDEIEIEKLLD